MSTLTQGPTQSDVIKWEQEHSYSRQTVTIASGQNLALGAVVGMITASGKYAVLDPAGIDGTEAAAGVAIEAYDASTADTAGVIIARDAIVDPSALAWPAGATAPQKAAALAELDALGIIARDAA